MIEEVSRPNVSDSDLEAIRDAFEQIDLAAAITNDLTETHGRRGRDAIRLPSGEQRGEKSELQLGRPTVFHVYFGTDEYFALLKQSGEPDVAETFTSLDRDDMLAALTRLKAIEYAEQKADDARRTAEASLSSVGADIPATRAWLLRGLFANMPTGKTIVVG